MIWLSLYIGSVVGAFLTMIVLTAMRNEQRHSIGRIGWMGLTLLSPPLAIVLFYFLAGKRISAEHDRREPIDFPDKSDAKSKEGESIELESATNRFTEVLRQRGLPQATRFNRIELIETPEDHLQRYLELFDSAEETLYVMSFVFDSGRSIDRLFDKMCEKAESGVQVRLLIDGFGSFFCRDEYLDRLRDAGGKAATFKPFTKLSRLAYFNFRDHRKIAVVDGQRAIVGGANLIGYEITDDPDEDTWHDLSLYVEGPAVIDIQSIFCSDWNFVTEEDLPPAKVEDPDDTLVKENCAVVGVLPVGPDAPTEVLDDFWLFTIANARERLWIQTPYFVPPPAIMRLLEAACRRDVDLRIMVPDESDLSIADHARSDYLEDLQEHGASIGRFQPGMIHAKVGIVDNDVAVVGSTNFDLRSFFLNYEASLVLQDPCTIGKISDWYDRQWERCALGVPERGWWRRAMGTAARLFATEL